MLYIYCPDIPERDTGKPRQNDKMGFSRESVKGELSKESRGLRHNHLISQSCHQSNGPCYELLPPTRFFVVHDGGVIVDCTVSYQ
jgi:hypothetical protein